MIFQKDEIADKFSVTSSSIGSAELSFSSTSEEFHSAEDEYCSCKEDDGYTKNEKAPPRRHGKFPPPLTTYTRYINASTPAVAMPRAFLQSIKQNGRFVLKEMDARPQAVLKAKRENGRLQFYLIRPVHDYDSPYSTSADEQEETEIRKGEPDAPIRQQDPDARWEPQMIPPKEQKRGFQSEDVKNSPTEQPERETRLQKEEIGLKSKLRSWQDDDSLFGDPKTETDSCSSEVTKRSERGATAAAGIVESNSEDSTKSKQQQAQHDNRLMGCEGNRCFWAPTQSFLQKSLVRMRPVVS